MCFNFFIKKIIWKTNKTTNKFQVIYFQKCYGNLGGPGDISLSLKCLRKNFIPHPRPCGGEFSIFGALNGTILGDPH